MSDDQSAKSGQRYRRIAVRVSVGIELLDASPKELRRLEESLDGVSPSQPGGSPTRA